MPPWGKKSGLPLNAARLPNMPISPRKAEGSIIWATTKGRLCSMPSELERSISKLEANCRYLCHPCWTEGRPSISSLGGYLSQQCKIRAASFLKHRIIRKHGRLSPDKPSPSGRVAVIMGDHIRLRAVTPLRVLVTSTTLTDLLTPPQRCPHCRKWICNERRRE